jgi:hypothetical protein
MEGQFQGMSGGHDFGQKYPIRLLSHWTNRDIRIYLTMQFNKLTLISSTNTIAPDGFEKN